jgi:recombination protein RecT
VALTTVAQNPSLLECDRPSLFRSVLTCAQLGLLPDAVLGEAYMVPYKPKGAERKVVQLQIGYKGLLKLARQSGQISTIDSGIVGANDTFEWEMGLDPKFRIIPAMGDRGEPIAVYAILRYKDGGFEHEVMTVDQVEAIRQASPTGNSPAWQNSWGEMARKTVIRRLLKKAPLSTEAAMAVAVDEARDERGQQLAITDDGIVPVEPEPAPVTAVSRGTGKGRARMAELERQAEEAVTGGDPEPSDPDPFSGE